MCHVKLMLIMINDSVANDNTLYCMVSMNETTIHLLLHLVRHSVLLPGLALSPGPLSISQHLLRKIERGPGDTASSANFIYTYPTMSDCTSSRVPALLYSSYVGGISGASRMAKSPDSAPEGAGPRMR